MSISLEEVDYAEKYAQLSKKFVTARELEEMYGFSRSWLSKCRMKGSKIHLPYIKMGRIVRYKIEAVNKYLEEHQIN